LSDHHAAALKKLRDLAVQLDSAQASQRQAADELARAKKTKQTPKKSKRR